MILPKRPAGDTASDRYAVRARYLFPGDAAPLRDACLTVQDGRIVAVGAADAAQVLDLGQAAILPGLINAHTHLEFSRLDAPLGTPHMPFSDWIRCVIAWRNEQRTVAGESDRWRTRGINAGIRESERAGITTLGEIATLPVIPIARYQDLAGIAFLELLGLRDELHDGLMAAAEQFVANFRSIPCGRPGLSPHAPYTVSTKLLERILRLSVQHQLPVAMHLAESREELALLRDAGGPLVELLRDLEAWQAGAIPLSARPMLYLESLARAQRSLVIHGNYLDPGEIEFVARHRQRMSLVYCPRTHAYFGHEPYPLAEMLKAGARVALGTDSRASNPDLDVLNELRFAARRHPLVSPREILRMATIDAAGALGLDDRAGSLAVGKVADFVVLPIGDDEPQDPHELIFTSDSRASAVFWSGTIVKGTLRVP